MKNVSSQFIGRSSFLWLILVFVGSFSVSAQSISGVVVDADGSPVVNALVFVANTTLQTQSGADGSFSLDKPAFSGFEIAAVGSDNSVGSIRVTPETSELSISLAPPSAPSTSSTSTLSREELLEFFHSTTFSWTKNASDVSISNPEDLVLEFDESTNVITAKTKAPFTFVNDALGYDVTIYGFEMGGNQVAYGWSGYALYSPLEAARSKDQRTWDKNRQKAYEGSLRHFLTAIASERLKKEEFAAFFVEGPGSQSDHSPIFEADLKSVYGTPQPILFDGKISPSKRLDFTGWLRVQYYGSGGDTRWERYIDRFWPVSDLSEVMKDMINISFIQQPDYQAIFDASGILWPSSPPSVQQMGYWSFFRLADTLPHDWVPEE